jgi:hypothetical protein
MQVDSSIIGKVIIDMVMRSKAEALTSAGEPRGDERNGLSFDCQTFEVEVVSFQAGSALSKRSSAISVGQALSV